MPPSPGTATATVLTADANGRRKLRVSWPFTGARDGATAVARVRASAGAAYEADLPLENFAAKWESDLDFESRTIYDVQVQWFPAPVALTVLTPLALDRSTIAQGETITGTVTYKNNTGAPIQIQDIVIGGRPPGSTIADGPLYWDFSPSHGAYTFAAGEERTLTASRTATGADPIGTYTAFTTYRNAAGAYVNDTANARTFGVTSAGATRSFYVAPSGGNDANAGTDPALPLASVQAGLNKLTTPGDTLFLRGGTYALPAQLNVVASGTSALPITIRSYPGEQVTLDGHTGTSIAGPFTRRNGLVAQNRSWLVVDGIRFYRFGQLQEDAGLAFRGCTDIIVRNCWAGECWDDGIQFDRQCNRVQVLDCEVEGCTTGIDMGARDAGTGQAFLIARCRGHHNDRAQQSGEDCDGDQTFGEHGGQFISLSGDQGQGIYVGPGEIRDCEGWENRVQTICYKPDGAFVEWFFARSVSIHHCKSRDNVVFIEASGSLVGARVYKNESLRESFIIAHQWDGAQIENNTSHGHGYDFSKVWTGSGTFGTGNSANVRFRNNIVTTDGVRQTGFGAPGGTGVLFQLTTALAASATFTHNLYNETGAGAFGTYLGANQANLAAWQSATGKEQNSLQADPLFANIGAGDYSLQAGSPAVDSGVVILGVTDGYIGSLPDRGRWERGSSA